VTVTMALMIVATARYLYIKNLFDLQSCTASDKKNVIPEYCL
jgi:hypothetical protein